ncbi:MAG: hypothetical protein JWM82_1716 [Myxococcales bacterium]|nr:hypothetical protein [Myxococcales bacterium]
MSDMNIEPSGSAASASRLETPSRPDGEISTTALTRPSTALATTRSASVGLGWFSVGLGLAELAAPGALATLVGVPDRPATRWIVRGLGARELGVGLALLSRPKRAGWLWARTTGDLIDLTLLGTALLSPRTNRLRAGTAMAAVVGAAALDAWAGKKALETDRAPVRRTITIGKPANEIYAYWRDLGNLPRFMDRIESVELVDARRSRWRARGPVGASVTWDAEIVEDRAGDVIAWRASEADVLRHEGSVRFVPAPNGKSTELHVCVRYGQQQGVGAVLKSMLAPLSDLALGEQLEADLGRLKQLLETGQVMRSDASLHRGMHPARPAGNDEVVS